MTQDDKIFFRVIGGPGDGREISGGHSDFVVLLDKDGKPHHYIRAEVAGSSEVFSVWAIDSMSGDDLIKTLIANYRTPHDPG